MAQTTKPKPRPTKKTTTKKAPSRWLRLFSGSSAPVFVIAFAAIGVVAIGLSRADPLTDLLNSLTSGLNLNSSQTASNKVAPPAPLCGNTPIAKADGSYWQCTFDDEFDGTTLDRTKWVPQQTATSGFTTGQECFVDSPNNVSVAGGVLNLTIRKEAQQFTCGNAAGAHIDMSYTSGMVSTYGKFNQTYGRYEIRAKVPNVKVKGLQESFWLWPQNDTKYGAWPKSGEIDIAEIYHYYPDRAIPYIHYEAKKTDPNVTNNYCMIDISQFHTYVAEWTPTSIKITFDGNLCMEDKWDPASPLVKPQPFDHPYMIALTQAFGITGNAFDPAKTPLPATTQVDYVRVWK